MKKKIVIILSTLAVASVIALAMPTVILPEMKYNQAIGLLKEGKYSEAIEIFESLNEYKDSKELIEFADKTERCGLQYAFNEDSYTVVGVDEDIDDIVIPYSYKGYPVTNFKEDLFQKSSIRKLTIGGNVTTIPDKAFKECDSLRSVSIGEGVTSIGASAFSACKSLSEVHIGSNVTTIGKSAFENCTSLWSISIPDSVVEIDSDAFWRSGLRKIRIPDSVVKIGGGAFGLCESLTTVEIGNGVTSIERYTFYYCSSLKTVTYGENVKTIGESAFQGCPLGYIRIPNGVTTIEKQAFLNCDLYHLVIPRSVTFIGKKAFGGSHALKYTVEIESPYDWYVDGEKAEIGFGLRVYDLERYLVYEWSNKTWTKE